MNDGKTVLERAFEIARCGGYTGIEPLRKQLGREGYNTMQLTGTALAKQLGEIAKQVRSAPQERLD